MRSLMIVLAVITVASIFAGCSGDQEVSTRTVVSEELDGAPDWVLKGRDDNDKTISASGSMSGTNNVALARSGALGRARTELSRQLSLSVKAMLKDYQATVTGGGAFGEAADDEQYIEDVSTQLTEMNLTGTRQEDTWISKTGTYYVLVSLDLNSFKDTVQKMGNLSKEVRQAVSQRAEKAFADLDGR
jgi:hypothetical protein